MTGMRLSTIADLLGGRLIGDDAEFHSVSADSRALKAGDFFIALQGENFDGHEYVKAAADAGALAAMVSRSIETTLPLVLVPDTRLSLGRLAALWRARFPGPLVAITGSNGKTTVKEMVASILRQSGPVLATIGNLNNDIGVPLTLLRLSEEHEAAVIEMGASAAGEIAYLTALAEPTIAIITNATAAHLKGFGSIEDVAHAKGEIFEGLGEDGVAVINADDKFAPLWKELAGERRQITFGMQNNADITANPEAISCHIVEGNFTTSFQLKTPNGNAEIQLKLAGKHNVLNALAATAVALSAKASLKDVKQGLEALMPVAGRLQLKQGVNQSRIIDDTYNANPASLTAAIEVLAYVDGYKILVLGDMAELGADEQQMHRQIGEVARTRKMDALFAVGPLSQHAVAAFGGGAQHFSSHADLSAALLQHIAQVPAPVTVLIKGSRSSHMERVVEALTSLPHGKKS